MHYICFVIFLSFVGYWLRRCNHDCHDNLVVFPLYPFYTSGGGFTTGADRGGATTTADAISTATVTGAGTANTAAITAAGAAITGTTPAASTAAGTGRTSTGGGRAGSSCSGIYT